MVGYLVKKYLPETVLSQFLGAHDLVANYPGSEILGRQADFVFTHAHSNLAAIQAKDIPADRVRVIYRGINCNLEEGQHRSDNEIQMPYIFLTASRLIVEKGVDDSIRVFNALLKKYPASVLYIAGDGPHRAKLEELVSSLDCTDRVSFLGHIDQRQLLDRMSSSDFFILMSRYESERLPNVVKEAMLRRCLVVASQTNGIHELIEHGESGFIVPQGDVESAVEMIESVIVDPGMQKRLKENAFDTISVRFNVQCSMHQYLSFWSDAIDRLEKGQNSDL
jgi:glycosyltransferase involved in cell wall biosynthesis